MTFDWLLGRRGTLDFVKIDVEVAELLVLNGAPRLLDDVKPVIYGEVRAECNSAVTALLQGTGTSFTIWRQIPH